MLFDIVFFIITSPFKGVQVLWSALTTDTRRDERAKGWLIEQAPNQEVDIQEIGSDREAIPDFDDYFESNENLDHDFESHEDQNSRLRYIPEEGYIGLDEAGWWVDDMMASIIDVVNQLPEKIGALPGGYRALDYGSGEILPDIILSVLISLFIILGIAAKMFNERYERNNEAPVDLDHDPEIEEQVGAIEGSEAGSVVIEEEDQHTENYITDCSHVWGEIIQNSDTAKRFEISLNKLQAFDDGQSSLDIVAPLPDELIIRRYHDTESSLAESPSQSQPRSRAHSIASVDSPLNLSLLSDEISKSLEAEENLLIPVPEFPLLSDAEVESQFNELCLVNVLDGLDDSTAKTPSPLPNKKSVFFEGNHDSYESFASNCTQSNMESRDSSMHTNGEVGDSMGTPKFLIPGELLTPSSFENGFQDPFYTPGVFENEYISPDIDDCFPGQNIINFKNSEKVEVEDNIEIGNDLETGHSQNRPSKVDRGPVYNVEPLKRDSVITSEPHHNISKPYTSNRVEEQVEDEASHDMEDLASLDANTSTPFSASMRLDKATKAGEKQKQLVHERSPLTSIDTQINRTPTPSPSKIPIKHSPYKLTVLKLGSPTKGSASKNFKLSQLVEQHLIDPKIPEIDTFLNVAFGKDVEIDINVELLEVLSKENIDGLLQIYKGKETSQNWKARYDNFGLLIGHLRLHLPRDLYLYFEEQLFEILEDVLAMVYSKRSKLVEKVILFVRDIVYYSNDFALDDELYATLLHLLIHLTKSRLEFINKPAMRSLCLMIQALNLDSFKRCFSKMFENIFSTKSLQEEKSSSLLMIKFYLSVKFHEFSDEDFEELLLLILPFIPVLATDAYQKTRSELVEIYLIIMKKIPESTNLRTFYDSFSAFVRSKVSKPDTPALDSAKIEGHCS